MIGRLKQAGLVWPGVAGLIALTILLGLGTWQLQRKAWKDALVRQIDLRVNGAAKRLDVAAIFATDAATRPLPYERVLVSGKYHHEKERFLFADGREGSGFHVLTPLEVGPGQVVWINRGYVPAALKDPAKRAAGQIAGVVEVAGLAREQGDRNAFTPDNDVQKNVWYWRDLPALSRSAFGDGKVASAPLALDASLEPKNPGGWPRGGTTLLKISNRHLEYAGTWYGLAATLIGVFFVFARGRLKAAAAT